MHRFLMVPELGTVVILPVYGKSTQADSIKDEDVVRILMDQRETRMKKLYEMGYVVDPSWLYEENWKPGSSASVARRILRKNGALKESDKEIRDFIKNKLETMKYPGKGRDRSYVSSFWRADKGWTMENRGGWRMFHQRQSSGHCRYPDRSPVSVEST